MSKKTTDNLRSKFIYGYQGSEKDDEVKEAGNSYTTFYRMLDPRLGRWFSIDPVFQPHQSPYNSMDNNPILNNDPLGDRVINQEEGVSKREFRRMVREARKQNANFDAWYRSKRWDGKRNYMSFSDINVNSPNHPTNFTSPKYVSGDKSVPGAVQNPGVIINIGPNGTESAGTSGADRSGHYYFNRLERGITNTETKSAGNPIAVVIGGDLAIPGFRWDRNTESYSAEFQLSNNLFTLSGWSNPVPPNSMGLIVNYDVTDGQNTPIANFNVVDNNPNQGSTPFGPMLLFSNDRTVRVTLTITNPVIQPIMIWRVNASTTTVTRTTKWGFNPMRLFRREALTNL